jgi:hypothetical protein
MNYFAYSVILLFLGAAAVEAWNGRVWMCVFYLCSALINVAVLCR